MRFKLTRSGDAPLLTAYPELSARVAIDEKGSPTIEITTLGELLDLCRFGDGDLIVSSDMIEIYDDWRE